jgi:hypothetical protein
VKEIEEANQIRLCYIDDPGAVEHVNSSSATFFASFL